MHSDYSLLARDDGCGFNYYQDGQQCVRKSNWDLWGRWLVCGIAVTIAIALLSVWVQRAYSTTTTTTTTTSTTFPDSNRSEFYDPTYGGYGLTPSYGEVQADGHARGHGTGPVPPSVPVPVSFVSDLLLFAVQGAVILVVRLAYTVKHLLKHAANEICIFGIPKKRQ